MSNDIRQWIDLVESASAMGDLVPDSNWDTRELTTWILNDDNLYDMVERTFTVDEMKDRILDIIDMHDSSYLQIDPDEIDWDQVFKDIKGLDEEGHVTEESPFTKQARIDPLDADLKIKINGIPALIKVTKFDQHKGDPNTWASDLDYHGYVDIEYEIYDRKGWKAPWLEKKISRREDDLIKDKIIEKLQD